MIFLLLVLGGITFFKNRVWAKRAVVLGVFLLFIFSLPLLPTYLMLSLENRIVPGEVPRDCAGVIVLAGSVDMANTRQNIELNEHADRIIRAIILVRQKPGMLLVITGGSGTFDQSEDRREADHLKRLAIELGVDPARIVVERDSRTTAEHPRKLAQIISKDKEWILVTSATHMPRSLGVFRKAGFKVFPYPVDYRLDPNYFSRFSPGWFVPSVCNLELSKQALHEFFGLAIYRIVGYTDALFPK